MPYNTDPNLNKDNAWSPSEHLTVNEQLMYRLAALDASVTQGFRRLDEKMDRFQADLHANEIAANDRINKLASDVATRFEFKRARIDQIEKRMTTLETWSQVLMGKVAIAVAALIGLWTFIAPTVRGILGISNG